MQLHVHKNRSSTTQQLDTAACVKKQTHRDKHIRLTMDDRNPIGLFDDCNSTQFGICFQRSQCWDANDPDARVARCWALWLFLFTIGCLLLVYVEFTSEDSMLRARLETRMNSFVRKLRKEGESESDALLQREKLFQDSFVSSPIIQTRRTEENFLRNHTDPNLQLPSSYSSEYDPAGVNFAILPLRGLGNTKGFPLMRSSGFRTVLIGSIGWGLVCSSLSTVLWLMNNFDETCSSGNEDTNFKRWIRQTGDAAGTILSDYTFYPVFLLTGYVTFIASRWRTWMSTCHSIQGSINNLALMLGGSFIEPPTAQQRKQLYKIYRYMNAIHMMGYKSISPSISYLDLEDFVDKLCLLTVEELDILTRYPSKDRDLLISMLASEIAKLCETADNIATSYGGVMTLVGNIRGEIRTHHDTFITDNANLYVNIIIMCVNILILFTLLSMPFSLLVDTPHSFLYLPCFQPFTFLGTVLLLIAYRSAFLVISRLRNPFNWIEDRIKVDELIASTEMYTFTVLRTSFHVDEADRDDIPSLPEMRHRRIESSGRDTENVGGIPKRGSFIIGTVLKNPHREHVFKPQDMRNA